MSKKKIDDISSERYSELFKSDTEILKAALEQAYEVRKFEIELYWKRATYFWTFIGASFAAYAAFAVVEVTESLLLLTSCIGLVFSVAWHCVNKGSKFWQENWENHVELLEDEVMGPLYKSYSYRPGKDQHRTRIEKVEDFFVAPMDFSVSKINQLVSTFMTWVWIFLVWKSIGPICIDLDWDVEKAFLIFITVLTCSSFWLIAKSHSGNHSPKVAIREARVFDEHLEKALDVNQVI